jgi:transposase
VDLAKYCVNAVLVEGRSVRAVAAVTGRSKSWVHRHVALYREGGDEALVPLKRGPKVPANLTSAALEGEIVAYHLTLKKWLRKKPAVATLAELQAQIDRFVHIYNEERPHTARGCTPMRAWRALDKATIEIDGQPLLAHTKVRRDRVDKTGCFTLRYRSKLHHIGVGRALRGKRVLILVADLDVRVIDEDGITIRHLELDPSVDYQGRVRDIL